MELHVLIGRAINYTAISAVIEQEKLTIVEEKS